MKKTLILSSAVRLMLHAVLAAACILFNPLWLGLAGAVSIVTAASLSPPVWRRLHAAGMLRRAMAAQATGFSIAALCALVAALRHEPGASFLFPIGGLCLAWIVYWLPKAFLDERSPGSQPDSLARVTNDRAH